MTSAGTVPVPEGVTLRDRFTGKEDQAPDFAVPYLDFGARQYSPALRRWLVPDPLSEKYYGISPYAYCAGNPVNLVDPDGQFLYIGQFSFNDGHLYDQGGSLVEIDDIDDFSRKAYNALLEISKTTSGKELLDELEFSNFTFIISPSETSEFKQSDTRGAYALNNPSRQDEWVIGSGGTIFWNCNGTYLFTQNGYQQNSITDLAHEMFHAVDSNHGVLDNTKYNGIKKSEWQAVYNENVLRNEMGIPLRTYYQKEKTVDGFMPYGPRMVKHNRPIRPAWY